MSDEIEVIEKNKEIVTVDQKVQGLAALGSKENLIARINQFEETRFVIIDYIDRNFVMGVDYGPADPRNPKPTLLKPGAEKVCRLFNTSPTWMIDEDTWKMLGNPPGVVCYKCQIIDNATGKIIGEGRGAEKVGNKQRDANKTIKNAEKCSLVDACLYTFMLSEKFTQDDGGKAALPGLKTQLMADITEHRAGVESELTDLVWLQTILKQELHKTSIVTVNELAHIRKIIFDGALYDLATGGRFNA